MTTTSGNPFPINLTDAGIVLDATRDRRYLEIKKGPALRMFDNLAVILGDPTADALGLYSRLSIGRDMKASFGSFSTPKHLFSSRKNGCGWHPKGGVRLNLSEIDTCPIEYNGEQCPDAFWGNCMEQIFGTGNDVRDFLATPEGQTVVEMFMRQIMIGLGNSYYELSGFANHPMIETANTLGFYLNKVSQEEWVDFYDQMTSITCAGLVTIMDELSAEGQRGFDLDIPDASFNANGDFIGDPIALFERLMGAARGPLRVMVNNGIMTSAGRQYPIIRVTDAIFRAYELQIMTQFSTLPEAYRYQLLRSDGSILTMPNVLSYKGLPIIRWEESSVFDEIVGSTSHRAGLFAPGVLGQAYDVPELRQYEGMGLRIVQKLEAPDMGKMFMDTTLRVGFGIADPELMVYASNLKHP